MISDYNKHVGPSIDQKGETHIIDRIRKLLVRRQTWRYVSKSVHGHHKGQILKCIAG